MQRKLLSIFTAVIIGVGVTCTPAFAVENDTPKLEQNLNVNEQCEEIEIVGTISAMSTCWDQGNGLYIIYFCEVGEDDVYIIESSAVERLDMKDYAGKKVRIKGCLVMEGRINPITIEVIE